MSTADENPDKSPVVPVTSSSGPADGPLLFISHRHWDAELADVVREFVEDKGSGRIGVFQSSAPEADHPRAGSKLTPEVHEALWAAEVVILIYTTDEYWSSCAYEMGVARRRGGGERIIVLHVGGAPPWMLADSVSINLRKLDEVHRFVADFMTDKHFLGRSQSAITKHERGSQVVARAADELYQRFAKILPAEDVEDWPPYPYLRMELSFEHARELPRSPEDEEAAANAIRRHAIVTYADIEAARLFDMRRMFPGSSRDARCAVPFSDVIDSWRVSYPNSKSRWLEALSAQIVDCVQGGFPTLVWELMRSRKRGDDTWYAPFLARVRKNPSRKTWEFDVYFCKFIDDGDGQPKIGIPVDDLPLR